MGIPVKLEVFEGPLDLLLHLIEKNKVDIYDIPIVEITNQYMEYIRGMQHEDLNVMSEFLVMAATLLDIKCRMLLPKEVTEEGEEEDPRQELVEQLLQYKMYKYMAFELKDRELDSGQVMYKSPDIPEEILEYAEPVDLDQLLGDLTMAKLGEVFREIMKRQAEKIDPVRSKFGKIEKEEVSLSDKFVYVHEYMRQHKRFSFRQLLLEQKSKMHIVVTFLAILEMMKLGEIHVEQENTCGEIMIERIGEADEYKEASAAIEAILFTMGESVELSKIAAAIEQDEPTTRGIISDMMTAYEKQNRGIRIIELDHSFQLCTKKEYYDYLISIARQPKRYVLTDVMLETLSIIAYRQPVTKLEIEKIRGVKSDHAVNKLVEYGLVEEVGRMDAPGRPILFGTTEEFLRRFSVQSLDDLPSLAPEQIEHFKEEAEDEAKLKLDI